jgi:hypothetical protein
MNKEQDDSTIKTVPLSQIVAGPGNNSVLPEGSIERIKKFKEVFKEIDTTSLEEAVSNFQKDLHPENEIKIWEDMAFRYVKIMQENPAMTLDEKKNVFKDLLIGTPPIEVSEVE